MSKIKELCEIRGRVGWKGYTVEDLTDFGPLVLGANDITDNNMLNLSSVKHLTREKYEESPEIFIEKNDILVVKVGSTIGKVAIINQDLGEATINPNCVIVRSKKINPYYLYYYLCSPAGRAYLLNNSSASGQPALNQKDLGEMEIPLIDELKQEQVSILLNSINNKIENNNKINAELESMAKTIYNYWFLQFEFPNEEGKPYKSSGGKMLWNEDLKRMIPFGWDVKKLGDIFVSERGLSYSTKNIESGEGIPMINLANFRPGGGAYKIEGLKHFLGDYSEDKVLKPYELVMCNTQQTSVNFATDIIGRAMLIPDIFEGDIVSSHHVNTIRTESDEMKFYLLYLFNSDFFHKYIAGYTNGTNILGLTFSGVENYLCEMPSHSLLIKFAEIVEDVEKKKNEILKENKELSSLRDFLLPMLMNGQVGFKDGE